MHDRTPRSPRSPRRRRSGPIGLGVALAATLALLSTPATASAATPLTTATDGASTTACTGGAWPRWVQGAPAVHAGSPAGDYLWHSSTGWHLRVTHVRTTPVAFSGTIRANQPLHVTGYRLEAEDAFSLSADRLTLTYRFRNHGGLDGLDFTTECATRLGVSGRMNGVLLPCRRIWLGHAGVHPLQNPFAIYRRA